MPILHRSLDGTTITLLRWSHQPPCSIPSSSQPPQQPEVLEGLPLMVHPRPSEGGSLPELSLYPVAACLAGVSCSVSLPCQALQRVLAVGRRRPENAAMSGYGDVAARCCRTSVSTGRPATSSEERAATPRRSPPAASLRSGWPLVLHAHSNSTYDVVADSLGRRWPATLVTSSSLARTVPACHCESHGAHC